MADRVIFRLMRWWPPDAPREDQVDLYEEIKAGRKTREWRESSFYWKSRLFAELLKPKRAWFIVGFPKGNVPRLEADITNIVVHENQYEIQFENVVEVTE